MSMLNTWKSNAVPPTDRGWVGRSQHTPICRYYLFTRNHLIAAVASIPAATITAKNKKICW
jgi:hypothetical protein